MMQQTQAFLDSLIEWKDSANLQINDFDTIISLLNITIGARPIDPMDLSDVNVLKNRIQELMDNENVREDFLITGLAKAAEEIMENKISGHGDALLFHQGILNTELTRSISQKQIDEMSEPGYVFKALRELDTWKSIVAKNLGAANRRYWENDRMLAKTKM